MDELDQAYFEAYKRLDRLCSDMYRQPNGVSQYLTDMEAQAGAGFQHRQRVSEPIKRAVRKTGRPAEAIRIPAENLLTSGRFCRDDLDFHRDFLKNAQ